MIIQVEWKEIIISSIALIGAIWAGVQYLVKKLVDQRFNKRLEDHKFELQVLLENNKFDFQRKVQDFSLYTSRKHAIYAELYDLFLRADGYVRRLLTQPNITLQDFYDKQDLAYNLSKADIPVHIANRFVEDWENKNREDTISELIKYLEQFEYIRTKDAVNNAKNTFLVNRIFLSEETHKIMSELNQIYANIIFTQEVMGRVQPQNYKDIAEHCERLIKNLTEAVKSELAIGYYS